MILINKEQQQKVRRLKAIIFVYKEPFDKYLFKGGARTRDCKIRSPALTYWATGALNIKEGPTSIWSSSTGA